MSLQNNERFQKEIQTYKDFLEKITDETEKKELQKLLNDLIMNVKRMDNMYLDLVYSNQLNTIGSEMREKIKEIRKKIDTKIKNIKSV